MRGDVERKGWIVEWKNILMGGEVGYGGLLEIKDCVHVMSQVLVHG